MNNKSKCCNADVLSTVGENGQNIDVCSECKVLCNPVFFTEKPLEIIDQVDPIKDSQHFKSGGIEDIEIIRAKLSPTEFAGYLKGNVLRYMTRAGKKGSQLVDLKSAYYYLGELIGEFQ